MHTHTDVHTRTTFTTGWRCIRLMMMIIVSKCIDYDSAEGDVLLLVVVMGVMACTIVVAVLVWWPETCQAMSRKSCVPL